MLSSSSFHFISWWRDGIIRISVSCNSCAITIAGVHLPPQCDNCPESSSHFTWQPQHSPDPETAQSLDLSIGLSHSGRVFNVTSLQFYCFQVTGGAKGAEKVEGSVFFLHFTQVLNILMQLRSSRPSCLVYVGPE